MVRSIKSIAIPQQDVIVHDQRLHLPRILCHNAHSGLVRSHLARSDLLLRPLDVGKHHIDKHCNPVHAPRCEVPNRTVEGVVGVHSQTLEQ